MKTLNYIGLSSSKELHSSLIGLCVTNKKPALKQSDSGDNNTINNKLNLQTLPAELLRPFLSWSWHLALQADRKLLCWGHARSEPQTDASTDYEVSPSALIFTRGMQSKLINTTVQLGIKKRNYKKDFLKKSVKSSNSFKDQKTLQS